MKVKIEGNTMSIQSTQIKAGGGSARTVQNWMMKARANRCKNLVVHLPWSENYTTIKSEMSRAAARLNLNMSRSVAVAFTTRELEV